MVRGLVATLAGVTVEVQVETVLLLEASKHAAPKVSLISGEIKSATPVGSKDGLYSSASDCGVPPVVKPTTNTCPLFSSVPTSPVSDCRRLPVLSNLLVSKLKRSTSGLPPPSPASSTLPLGSATAEPFTRASA